MRRILTLFVFFQILCSSFVFAQTAKVIDVRGKVSVRKEESGPWKRAKVNMLLNKEAELKTRKKSECTLAFDESKRNVLTIKENSHIKIASIVPGNILLPEGRVFSIIEDIAQFEEFQIRTPTAISGARGTVWLTGAEEEGTSVFCFERIVYIQGLDRQGNVTQEEEIGSGFGIEVGLNGEIGRPFMLSEEDLREEGAVRNRIEGLRRESEREDMDIDDGDSLRDLMQEGREDYRESEFQELREDIEGRTESQEDSDQDDGGRKDAP